MSTTDSSPLHPVLNRPRILSYLLMAVVLLGFFMVIAIRGFDWGMYKDVLAYEYHYETLGVRGGWQWLIYVHWTRHLLAGIVSAPIHLLFPNNDAAWYAVATGVHFINGMLLFLLVDTLQRGKRPWLSFAVTLLFIFNTLQIFSHIDLGTGSHRKVAMGLTLFSMWCYLLYGRSKRENHWWLYLSLAAFALANSIYEQSMLFFLVNPLLVLPEDWATYRQRGLWAYIKIIARDAFLYVLFVVFLVFLLAMLFTSTSNFELSLPYIVGQILTGFNRELNPLLLWERLAPAFQLADLPLTLAVWAGLFALLFAWMRWQPIEGENRWLLGWLVLVGFGIMLMNIVNAAPTDFSLRLNERLIYMAAAGVSLLIAAGLLLLLQFLPGVTVRQGALAAVLSLLIAGGFTVWMQMQTEYLRRDALRVGVLDAIYEAVPSWDAPPYLLIVTDVHPQDDLWLNAQDINFPYTFDLRYGEQGILADVVFVDVPPENTLQMIRATEEGIISPLRRDTLIDPERLIILSYDSSTNQAEVLDQLPDEVLENGNFLIEAEIDWVTNHDLIGS